MNSQPFLSADTATEILSGRITSFSTEKRYGFIKTEDNQSYFFFADKREQINLKRSGVKNAKFSFNSGDEVEFELRPGLKNSIKMVAFNIRHISNFYSNELIENAAEDKTLKGTLIQKSGTFFIKHLEAEIFIPVTISEWEIDLDNVYGNRIDQTVEFKLNPTTYFKGLKATLTDRKFSGEYEELLQLKESEQIIPAVITGKIWQGLYAKILNEKVYAFALLPKELNEDERNHFFRFNIGDKIKVKIKAIRKNKRVSITIEE